MGYEYVNRLLTFISEIFALLGLERCFTVFRKLKNPNRALLSGDIHISKGIDLRGLTACKWCGNRTLLAIIDMFIIEIGG